MGITSPVVGLVVNALSGTSVAGDAVDHTILESTLRCVALFGIERMTMADVARDAGVGRATVFRRFESKDELIRRAFAFELTRIVEKLTGTIAAFSDPCDQLIELTVEAVRIAQTHPIAVRLMEDGTALAVHRDQEISALPLALLTERIADCAELLDVVVDAPAMAEVLWRFIGSVWLAPQISSDAVHNSTIRRMVQVILSPLASSQNPPESTRSRGER